MYNAKHTEDLLVSKKIFLTILFISIITASAFSLSSCTLLGEEPSTEEGQDVDITGISFDSAVFTYDGTEKETDFETVQTAETYLKRFFGNILYY